MVHQKQGKHLPTVIKKERKIKVRKSEAVNAYALASIINCRVFMYHTVQGMCVEYMLKCMSKPIKNMLLK